MVKGLGLRLRGEGVKGLGLRVGIKGLRLRGSGVGVITRSPSTSKWIPAHQISTS